MSLDSYTICTAEFKTDGWKQHPVYQQKRTKTYMTPWSWVGISGKLAMPITLATFRVV